jgi:hypothetical protein
LRKIPEGLIELGNLPWPLFVKEGKMPPFGKERTGGIFNGAVYSTLELTQAPA